MSAISAYALGDPLRTIAPHAPASVIEQLRAHSRTDVVRRGEWLMHEGEICVSMGFVLQGVLGMVTAVDGRTPHVLGLLLPGDSFGRVFNGPMPHSIEALTDAVILRVERDAFERVMRAYPDVEHHFIVNMLHELDAARTWVMILNGTRVFERVAAFIAILVQRLGKQPAADAPRPAVLQLPLCRDDIARCLGIRKESLSRALHRLDEDGLIRLLAPDRIEVPDFDALVEASGNDLDLGGRAQDERRYASPAR